MRYSRCDVKASKYDMPTILVPVDIHFCIASYIFIFQVLFDDSSLYNAVSN